MSIPIISAWKSLASIMLKVSPIFLLCSLSKAIDRTGGKDTRWLLTWRSWHMTRCHDSSQHVTWRRDGMTLASSWRAWADLNHLSPNMTLIYKLLSICRCNIGIGCGDVSVDVRYWMCREGPWLEWIALECTALHHSAALTGGFL